MKSYQMNYEITADARVLVELSLWKKSFIVIQVSMEDGGNIDRNILLSRWIIQDVKLEAV